MCVNLLIHLNNICRMDIDKFAQMETNVCQLINLFIGIIALVCLGVCVCVFV